jgi:hypothetical protein
VLLGYPTLGDYTDFHQGGLANISNYQAVADGTVGHITIDYVSGGSSQLLVALYADSSGQPTTRLATGSSVTNPVPGGWLTIAVSPPVNVTKGTWYWIALLSPANGGPFNFGYQDQAGLDSAHSASSSLSLLPDPWVAGANFPGTVCSFYASP